MAPGRKVGASRQQPTEEITDIERERAQTIMRNNQVLRSLGIPTLASIVNSSTTKSKGRAREESDPLYEPEDMEETGDAVLDEDQMDTMMAQPTPEGKFLRNVGLPRLLAWAGEKVSAGLKTTVAVRCTQWCRSRASSRAAGLFPYTRQEKCHHGFMDDFCGTTPDKVSYKVKLDDSDFESALLKENSVGDGDPKKNHSLDIKKRIKHMMSIHQWTEMLKPSGQRVKCQETLSCMKQQISRIFD
ncbi:unnamed protein product [Miscanthus lutarioriparius]|uniref:Uncharacterized protein n=1 Tax=Miscanthus lutarioriparius TaxID=422564 RepID=A0A811MJE6_9POAL|nr:unnamed protein product [Miscanthus lutarioriparius]